VYEPVGRPAPAAAQPTSVSYALPPADPKGNVYVFSLGAEQLPVGQNTSGLFLHARIAAENTSDTVPWRFDPNEQVLRIEGRGTPLAPSFAEASGGSPVLTLERGQRGQMDLYHPLPTSGTPPRTTLEWRVHRGSEVVPLATVFERAAGREDVVYYQPRYEPRVGVHLAVGPGWWWGYDYWPFYYGYAWPHYRPWYWYPGPRHYGYYAPPRRHYYYPAPSRPSGGSWRGYPAPARPAAPVGRPGFRPR
jgi:hypothetical protein